MELTKHTHATVSVGKGGHKLLIDPGTFTPDAQQLIAAADAILLTHDHFDHFDRDRVAAGLSNRAELHIYGPAPVVNALVDFADRVHEVAAGDSLDIVGFHVAVHGDRHALIHAEIPQGVNVGYLIDGALLHPGDAYVVPDHPVDTLLLPTSGPWTKMGEAIDYVLAVQPRQCIQIHDAMLSQIGTASANMFLGAQSPTQTELLSLAVGDAIEI